MIAFYVDRFSKGQIGGVHAYLRRISHVLQDKGIDTVILTQKSKDESPGEEELDGLLVVRLDCGDLVDRLVRFNYAPEGEKALLAKQLFKKSDIEATALKLARGLNLFIRDYKPRAIHFHNSFSLAPYALYFLKQNYPRNYPPSYYFWCHSPQKSLIYPDGSVNNLYNILASFQNMFKAIFSVSKYVNNLMLKAGINSKVRYLGVDTAVFKKRAEVRLNIRDKFGLSAYHHLALYSGRFIKEKGLDLLPKILEALIARDKKFSTFKFVLAGDGPYKASFLEIVKEHGLEDSFFLLRAENDDELVDIYSQANCFVFPTLREAFGLSITEAMSCSLPCFTTDLPGIREIITHTLNGILVKKGDISEFVRWISSVHFNSSLEKSLGIAARETIEKKFAFKEHVDYFVRRLAK